MYVDEGNLKDPTKNRITVDQTVKGIMEISQLQHNDNVVNISVEEKSRRQTEIPVTARVSLVQNTDKTIETFASFQHRHSTWSQLIDRFLPSL